MRRRPSPRVVLAAAVLAGLGLGSGWHPACARTRHHHARRHVDAPPPSAPAADTDPAKGEAETRQRDAVARADAARADEERLAAVRVDAATRLRGVEDAAAAQADAVAALAARRDDAAARLAKRAAALSPLLPLMERLALFPSETLLAVPSPPDQALLGLSILHGAARRLEQEAAALRQEQAALDREQTAVDEALVRLRTTQTEQTAQAAALDQQIAAAHALRLQAQAAGDTAARQVAAEAAQAETLRRAMAALETARASAEARARDDAAHAEREQQAEAAANARQRERAFQRPTGPGPAPDNALVTPVAGRVTRNWGDETDAGPATGVSYRSAPQARVVAPCVGRVRFAAPFRSYGGLVILDCGGGYAFVLAGMARLDVTAGAAVLAGEPVGAMADWNAAAKGSAGNRPGLYVELRHDGLAVDPAPFLRQHMALSKKP